MSESSETIADIIAEKRVLADRLEHEMAVAKECKELIAHRTAQAIIDSTRREADRLEAAHKREVATTKESLAVGNSGDCAKLRDALSDACFAIFNLLRTQNGGYEEMANALDKAKAALAAPPRNCDRFGGDIGKLREACARERGLNPEEDFPDVFPDWLLSTATEKEGGAE